jgi:tRNA dimethylallyltransferase
MKPLAIVGPTAGGKSRLAIALADCHEVEIISMDSMAVYQGAAIVTDQLPLKERQKVKHHMIDFLPLEEEFSTAEWKRGALEAIEDIQSRGKLPLIVGGTFLYLNAYLHGLHELPPADEGLRAQHQKTFDEEGAEALLQQLRRVDAVSAELLHANDFKRVSRALEIFELTGQTRTALFDSQRNKSPCDVIFLNWQREAIYERCNQRVDEMLKEGLLEEIEGLRARQLSQSFRQAVGVKEVMAHLDGQMTKEQMLDEMKKKTRHLAKHQFTWAKRFDTRDFEGDDPELLTKVSEFVSAYRRA